MSFYGDLRTVKLVDVLRWASDNEKTGVLEVERNAISRRIEFRKGWVGSCSSNDPASRLGQFLLSRSKLDEIQLQHLLTLQRVTSKRLGLLLVEMKVLSRADLTAEVTAKAQETIYGLFDFDDAVFRFDEGAILDPDQIEVNLSVEELIVEGEKRAAQLHKIRDAFESSGVVLDRTESEIPSEILERPLTRRMFDSIDGQRTIAEILLHMRTSEFLVLQFLARLHDRELVRISEVRAVPEGSGNLLDIRPCSGARGQQDEDWLSFCDLDAEAAEAEQDNLDETLKKAGLLLEREEFEAALELLRGSYREHGDDYSRRLLVKAETGFLESTKHDGLVSTVPILLQDRHALLDKSPSAEESFLLSLIDGTTDVQSILWLAPLREIDALMALRRMADKQMIELATPAVSHA